jgi:hypothetical protein
MTQAAVLASNASLMTTPSGTAPGYLARAWVNFNGTGTVAIRASGNVSSITDNGTGDYTVNFTTAMPDANYAVSSFGSLNAGGWGYVVFDRGAYLTSSVRVQCSATNAFAGVDLANVTVSIFR